SGGAIALNFVNGASIPTVTLNGVSYAVTATITGGVSTLTFAKSGGGTLTLAQAEALVDAFRYNNTSDTPTMTDRVFSITATDSAGATSNAANFTVHVQAVNDPPTLSATGLNPTFTETAGLGTQAAAVLMFSGAS